MNIVKLTNYLVGRDPKNFLLDDPEDISPLISHLKSSRNCHSFHISDGQISIGKEVAAAIANALAKHDELEELHMIAAFKGRQIDEVVECLKRLSFGIARSGCRLRLIDISENAFRGTGIDAMREILTGQTCYALEVLKVSDQGLSPEGGQTVARVIRDLHQNALREGEDLRLRSFKASKNRIENGGALALGPVFRSLESLQEVEMYQCGMWSEGVTAIVNGLSSNRQLKFLDLTDNSVNEGAENAMIQSVRSWPQLEELRLSSCLLSGQCVVKLLKAIKDTCRAIKTLDLSDNEVEDDVKIEVLQLLLDMPTLENVVLKGNDFFTKVVRAMYQARFEEMGKPDLIKSQLSGHTYGGESEEEEDEDEDDGESDVSSKNTVEENRSVTQQDPANDFLLTRHGDSKWSVTPAVPDEVDQDAPFYSSDLFGLKLERNNCFTVLGITIKEINDLFDAKDYRAVVVRIVDMVYKCIDELSDENDSVYKKLNADHHLDALLQFTEYLVAYSSIQTGSILLDELFRCCGLCNGKALSDENQLRALAWLLRHILYGNALPLFTIVNMQDQVEKPSNGSTVQRLKAVEGFTSVFDELKRQSELD